MIQALVEELNLSFELKNSILRIDNMSDKSYITLDKALLEYIIKDFQDYLKQMEYLGTEDSDIKGDDEL